MSKKNVIIDDTTLEKKTIKDISRVVAKRFKGISVNDIEMIITEIFAVIREMVISNKYVLIKNFGGFFASYKDAKIMHDPRFKTDVKMEIPRRRYLNGFFTLKFKRELRNYDIETGRAKPPIVVDIHKEKEE